MKLNEINPEVFIYILEHTEYIFLESEYLELGNNPDTKFINLMLI